MDSASLTSLSPFLDDIDRWVELAPLLPVIISLELVLSADNAIALASITKRLKDIETQKLALNVAITFSLLLRIILILTAEFILKFWQIKLLAASYLFILFITKLIEKVKPDIINQSLINSHNSNSLFSTILLLAFTDLAFSIDSVAAAVSISDQFLLVITGAIIGVIALRFTSGLFIGWLEDFPRLEIAGYIAVGLAGVKLLLSLIKPDFTTPEWIIFVLMTCLLSWGFSIKNPK
tara:strand:+ start:2492 stop:3199 length:708 start_codon:yes stop_codon:yes gene_type:complete